MKEKPWQPYRLFQSALASQNLLDGKGSFQNLIKTWIYPKFSHLLNTMTPKEDKRKAWNWHRNKTLKSKKLYLLRNLARLFVRTFTSKVIQHWSIQFQWFEVVNQKIPITRILSYERLQNEVKISIRGYRVIVEIFDQPLEMKPGY